MAKTSVTEFSPDEWCFAVKSALIQPIRKHKKYQQNLKKRVCLFEAALVSLSRVVSVADTSVITLPILTPGHVYPNLHHQYSKLVDCEELFYGISQTFVQPFSLESG